MKKLTLATILCFGFLVACESPHTPADKEVSSEGVGLITATFLDGTGGFVSEGEPPYEDTINIALPYYYPEESTNEIDISEMRLTANVPNNVVIEPSLSVHDLNNPFDITVTLANGEVHEHTIVGDVQKSSQAQIESFSLPEAQINGFVVESEKLVGMVSGGADLSNLTPEIEISAHATITPDPSESQNFNEPVVYTVTAHDGTQVEYTVREFTPNKVESGIRRGSEKLLWESSAGDLGFTEHMETAIATSGDYLVLNTREQDLRYYNRFSGEFEGTLSRGGLTEFAFQNFTVANDSEGNLISGNLALGGNDYGIYLWDSNNLGQEPTEFLRWTNATGNQVGRKLSVSGNLEEDAVIFTTVSHSSTILRWDVVGGVLQSQEPQEINYTGSSWTFLADAVSEGNSENDNIFLASYGPGDVAYINSSNGEPISSFDLEGSGYIVPQSLDYIEFNGADYLASIDVIYDYAGKGHLYDVTIPANLGTQANDPEYSNFEVYQTPQMSADGNANSTGDISLAVSEDGYKLYMYILLTNGGIAAYEFDNIDVENLY